MAPLLQHLGLITEDRHALDIDDSSCTSTSDVPSDFLSCKNSYRPMPSFKCGNVSQKNNIPQRKFLKSSIDRESYVSLSKLIKERNSFGVVQKLLSQYSDDEDFTPPEPKSYTNKMYRDATAKVHEWIGKELKSLGVHNECRSIVKSHYNFKEATLPCHVCNKLFVYQSFLDKHVAAKHGKTISAAIEPSSTEQELSAAHFSEPNKKIMELIAKKKLRSLANAEFENKIIGLCLDHKQTLQISPDKTPKLNIKVIGKGPKPKMRILSDKPNYKGMGFDLQQKKKLVPHNFECNVLSLDNIKKIRTWSTNKPGHKIISLGSKPNIDTLSNNCSEYDVSVSVNKQKMRGSSNNKCSYKATGLVPQRKLTTIHRRKLIGNDNNAMSQRVECVTLD